VKGLPGPTQKQRLKYHIPLDNLRYIVNCHDISYYIVKHVEQSNFFSKRKNKSFTTTITLKQLKYKDRGGT
jgi:hypothetical protein